MRIVKILILIFAININLFAQNVEFFGKFEPGNLVIGEGENIDWVVLDGRELQVDKDKFAFGFDRDDSSEHLLRIKFKDGKLKLKKFVLPEREYNIQRINNMQKKYVSAPNQEIERIEKESEIIRERRAEIGKMGKAYFDSGFVRPVEGGRISSVFGSQRILNGTPKNPHNGTDIAIPRGTPVHAMADGIVRLAADNFYYSGNFVMLDHGQGLSSVYLHMSKLNVEDGQRIKKGDTIGEVGTTGRSTGPHLHWGVQWFDKRIDPLTLLDITGMENK